MQVSLDIRHALAAGGFLALALAGGCSDSTPTGSAPASDVKSAGVSAMLTAADVVVQGGDEGAFVNGIVPGEIGFTNGAFWDNASDDGANCNVGYYATNAMGANCRNEIDGSSANQGGFTGGKYWGNGPANRKTSSFMFSGAYAYKVTFLGSYAGEPSDFGYFTNTGGTYEFHPLGSNTTVGTVAFVPPTGGANWGFYLKHDGHEGVGCAPKTDCSDALGDMHDLEDQRPVQQFALMINADQNKFLVGIEDNEEAVVAVGDDDFQDIILSVEPFAVPMFVIGDVESHGINDIVNFWGAQWWKNNIMSGLVSNGVAAFKGYTVQSDGICGGTWTTRPGNSSNPPAVIPEYVGIIVTSTVLKDGADISGDIRQIVIVHQDGGYGPNPGHAGNGPVTSVICSQPPG